LKRDPKLDKQIGGERLGQREGDRSMEPKTGNLAGERLERLETMPNPSRGKKPHGKDGRKKQRNATNDENMSGNRRDNTTTRNPIITRSEDDENYSSNDEEEGERSDGVDGEFETTQEVVAHSLPKSIRSRDCQGMGVAVFAKRLFAKTKFVLSDKELEFSVDNKTSICYQCLQALNMPHEKTSKGFWEEYKHVVTAELSSKRSNVAYAMRKDWMSKFIVEYYYCRG
jgi:hypothetical protein